MKSKTEYYGFFNGGKLYLSHSVASCSTSVVYHNTVPWSGNVMSNVIDNDIFLFKQIFVIGFVISLIKCRSEDHDDSEMDDLDSDEEPFITA